MRKTKPNNLTKIAKGIVAISLSSFLLFIGLTAYFQTSSGKALIAKQIEERIQLLIPSAKVTHIEGHFPWRWEIAQISGSLPSSSSFPEVSFDLEKISLDLNVLSFLFGSPKLSFLGIEKAHLFLSKSPHHFSSLFDKNESASIPIHLPPLSIAKLSVVDCSLFYNSTTYTQELEGSFSINPKHSKLKLELVSYEPKEHAELWEINVQTQPKQRFVFEGKTLHPMHPLLREELSIPEAMKGFLFDFRAEGPLPSLQKAPPISLQLKASDPSLLENSMKVRAFLSSDHTLEVSHIDVKLPAFSLQGHVRFSSDLVPQQGFLEFETNGAFTLHNQCKFRIPIQGQIEIDDRGLVAKGFSKEWTIDDCSFEKISFSARATHNLFWHGNLAIASDSKEERLLATSEFSCEGPILKLIGARLELPSLSLNGEGEIDLFTSLTSGYLFAQTDSLSQIPCASLLPIEAGKAALELTFNPTSPTTPSQGTPSQGTQSQGTTFHGTLSQGITWSLKAEEGVAYSCRFASLDCSGSLELNPSLPLQEGLSIESFEIEGKDLYWKWNHFEELSWNIQKNSSSHLHELFVKGTSKQPFNLHSKWSFAHADNTTSLTIYELDGSWLQLPIYLKNPCSLTLKESVLSQSKLSQSELYQSDISLSDFALEVGSGSLSGHFLFNDETIEGKITSSHFPLSPLSSFAPDVSLIGTISSEWSISGTPLSPQGRAWIELEPSLVRLEEGSETITAKGSIRAFFDHNYLQVHMNLLSALGQYLEGELSLPIAPNSKLQGWGIAQDKPFSGHLRGEGKIEELLPFLKFDAHRIEGQVTADLFFSKTPADPFIQGTLSLKDGVYESLSYGTHLKGISLLATADRDRLVIEEGDAIDGKDGSLSFSGKILLSPSLGYPFDFTGSLQQLEILKADFADAVVTGDLRYKGSLREGTLYEGSLIEGAKAMLSGSLQSDKLELKIPDKLTEEIPKVDVEFIRLPSKRVAPHLVKSDTLYLDLDLNLKEKVFVSGRGLSSEWKGNLKIGGTSDHILPTGSLELLRGKFLFAGKTFNLNDGTIAFSGKELTPNIRLEGSLAMSDLSVTAILQGPLTSPQLSFQSIPYMPTSSLLSRLLFNKDVSEINPIQAYQLAETLISLSGSGVNILEAIQKSLGIDKLSLVSGKNRFDEVSVQIGKYLYKGVMIALSQSASSSEVMVEVELKKGFILQAETVEDDGKFTLKWNYNY